MRTTNIAQGWMALVGLVLLAAGLVGFLNTPLAGSSANALLATDTVHNVVHLLTGLLAHFIGPRLTVFVAGLAGAVATVVFVYYRKKLRIQHYEIQGDNRAGVAA